jgi:hypothetical protein
MRKNLVSDAATRELRLRYEDCWHGEHEVTEYRVTDARDGGDVVRNRGDLDGSPVLGTVPGLYVRDERTRRETRVWTEQLPVAPTAKSPCPRAANARRRCALSA